MKTFILRIGFILFLSTLVLTACAQSQTAAPAPTTIATAPAAANAPTGKIVFGDISDKPADVIKSYQPLADYLGAHLASYGIGAGTIKVAPDLDTMIKWLKAGEVDLYFDSVYPAMIANEQTGGQIFLRRWKGGVGEYHTLILVRSNSGITSLDGLKGHMVAFDQPYSTTAFMVPLAYLIKAGLKVAEKSSADATVAKDEVGYVFAKGDDNIIRWTLDGKVAAGALADSDLVGVPQDTIAGLTPILTTDNLPRHVVVARPGMQSELLKAITSLLVGVDQQPQGKDILKAFEKTAKFDQIPDMEGTLKRMQEWYAIVQAQNK